jgi:hypothetical protein
MMKKKLCLLAVLILFCSFFSGCSQEDLYYDYDMTEFLSVGEYDFIVDKSDDEYEEYYNSFYKQTFGNDLDIEVYVGPLNKWDVAKVEYKVFLDGQEIREAGNTAIDLTVGSEGSLIKGFEEVMVGAEIGVESFWITTLPDDFYMSDLAGQEVEIRYTPFFAVRGDVPTESDAKKRGYNSLADYETAAENFSVSVYIFNKIYDSTKINAYPEYETEVMLEEIYDNFKKEKGLTPEQVATSYGWTFDELRAKLVEGIQVSYKNMPKDLVSYYILQTYDAKLTEEDIDATRQTIEDEVEGDILEAGYTEIEVQRRSAYEKALAVLLDKAIVK